SITRVQTDLAAKRLDRSKTAVGALRNQWEKHLQRVRSGREEYERQRHEAEQAAVAIPDRCSALAATPGLARYLESDLARLQPDLEALAALQREEAFTNVHQQVKRLNARLDELSATAQAKIAQAEKQKAVVERLVTAVVAARGLLLAGYPQHRDGKPAIVRFLVTGRGVLHVEIGADGPIVVRAEGVKFEQRRSPGGQVENTCDEFVEWFEQIRDAARTEGLEIGALHWGGEPTPERAQAKRLPHSSSRAAARHGGSHR
ncbi:MAG: hypothetical protein WCI73_08640, partial [Phycisphaerae bacterium]